MATTILFFAFFLFSLPSESRHVARDSVGTWCIAKQDASEAELQEALDWACGTGSGQGNIDCSTIQSSGSCYSPDSVIAHASYAFNQYYQKTNQLSTSCDFSGLAQTTNIDPSKSPCIYPSSSSGLSITSTSNSTSSSQFAAPVTSTTPTIPTTTSTPTTATPMTTFGGGNNDSITDMGSTDVGSTNSETPSLATSLAPSHHLCYSFLITCFFFILVSNHKQ